MTDRMRHLPCGQVVNSNHEFPEFPPGQKLNVLIIETDQGVHFHSVRYM